MTKPGLARGETESLPSLGNFCLVWSVLCVPPRVLKEVPLDHWRHDGVVVPHSDI